MEQNRVALRNVHLGHDPLPPFEKVCPQGGSKLLSNLAGFEPSSLEIKKSLADSSTSD